MKDHRRNIYFRSPQVYAVFQAAIEQGIIRARSASERIEELIVREMRRHVSALRAAGIAVPESLLTKSSAGRARKRAKVAKAAPARRGAEASKVQAALTDLPAGAASHGPGEAEAVVRNEARLDAPAVARAA